MQGVVNLLSVKFVAGLALIDRSAFSTNLKTNCHAYDSTKTTVISCHENKSKPSPLELFTVSSGFSISIIARFKTFFACNRREFIFSTLMARSLMSAHRLHIRDSASPSVSLRLVFPPATVLLPQ